MLVTGAARASARPPPERCTSVAPTVVLADLRQDIIDAVHGELGRDRVLAVAVAAVAVDVTGRTALDGVVAACVDRPGEVAGGAYGHEGPGADSRDRPRDHGQNRAYALRYALLTAGTGIALIACDGPPPCRPSAELLPTSVCAGRPVADDCGHLVRPCQKRGRHQTARRLRSRRLVSRAAAQTRLPPLPCSRSLEPGRVPLGAQVAARVNGRGRLLCHPLPVSRTDG